MDELSEEDKLTVARARKIQRFLSQPFLLQRYLQDSGKLVNLESTIKGFDAICGEIMTICRNGTYGRTIEEAIAKAEKMASEAAA